MARLLISSRSMALALRLADVHQIDEHSPDDLDGLRPADDTDAVVLDVGEAEVAIQTVDRLRAAGYDTPVLLVSGYQPEWTGVRSMGLAGVHVVPLPITRAALLEGIGNLTGQMVDLSTIPPTPAYGTATVASPDPAGDAEDGTGGPAGDDETARAEEQAPDTTEMPKVSVDPDTAAELAEGEETAEEPPDEAPEAVEDAEAGGAAAGNAAERAEDAAQDAAAGAATPQATTDDEPATAAVSASGAVASEAPPRAFGSAAPALTPAWGTAAAGPVDDPGDWGPPPHRPPSTSHPAAASAVPPTPMGGIRRSGTNGQNDQARPAPATGGLPLGPATGAVETQGAGPATGSIGMRRRNMLPGRLGRTRIGGRPAGAPVTPPTGQIRARAGQTPPAGQPPVAGQAPAQQVAPAPFTPAFGARVPAESPPETTPPAGTVAPDAPGPLTSALEQRLDLEAAAGARAWPRHEPAMRTVELMRMLLERAGELYGVGDTAQVLADDVVERADADAAAVLVPDGAVWRVGGGVGLRPLERRLVLDESHWLIAEIARPGRAVLIEDTDIIRQQLAGAPLAAWRHLLAVPVPDVQAAVVLARGQEAGPFTDQDLTAVVPTVREAATLLTQAIETRRLARTLASLQELDTEPPARPDTAG